MSSLSSATFAPTSFTHAKDALDHGDSNSIKGLVTEFHQKIEKPHVIIEGDIKILKTVDLNCDGMCCRFSETGEKLAVGLSNGDIKIYQGTAGNCIYHLSDDETKADRLPATSIHFIPAQLSNRGELLVATYASGMIKFWHISTGTALQTIHEPVQLLTSSLAPTAAHLVAGGSSEEIFVYDIETAKKINVCAPSLNRLVMDGHRFRICALKHHSQEDNIFLSGGWDDTLQIWDQREEHAIRRIYGPHICGEGIDFDGKHGHILTASWRKHDVLQVWDYKMGNRIKTIPPDFSGDSLLYCGQWLGREHMISGGSDNNMIRIVDKTTLATSGMITNLPSGVYSVDHDQHRLLHHHHGHSDATVISAVAGKHLYFISNAPAKRD